MCKAMLDMTNAKTLPFDAKDLTILTELSI